MQLMDEQVDNRLRMVELWVARHEAKCEERYTSIQESSRATASTLSEMKTSMNRRMDWLLLAIIGMAVVGMVGAEHVGILLSFIRG